MTAAGVGVDDAVPFWTGEDDVRADQIESLEDAKLWAAAHDAESGAYWKAQWQTNESTSEKFGTIYERLGQMERRLFFFAGVGAGVGGLVGSVVAFLLSR